MSNQDSVASGHHEFTYHHAGDATLQMFSTETMSSTFYSPQEALDLLHFLQSHADEIEEKARQQAQAAQQPKQKKSIEQRLNNLFGEGKHS